MSDLSILGRFVLHTASSSPLLVHVADAVVASVCTVWPPLTNDSR